jgi:hypothetical protein
MSLHSCKEPFSCHLEIKYLVFYMFQEEVVLKRCWLARYWGLAAKYGNPWNMLCLHSSQREIILL